MCFLGVQSMVVQCLLPPGLPSGCYPHCAITSYWSAAMATGVGEGQELWSWKQKRMYDQGLAHILWFNFYTTQKVSHCETGTISKFAVKHLKNKVISISREKEDVQRHQFVFSQWFLERCPLHKKGPVWEPKWEENGVSQSFRNLRGYRYPQVQMLNPCLTCSCLFFFLSDFWPSFLSPLGLELTQPNGCNASSSQSSCWLCWLLCMFVSS